MVTAQGYTIAADGTLLPPEAPKMSVPTFLLPHCPHCGKSLVMNLRCDDKFVEDEGWHQAAERYMSFIRTRKNQNVLYLELGVGYNTPGIIKYPFWCMTDENPNAIYACLNYDEAYAPSELQSRFVCIRGDIGTTLKALDF